MSSTLLNRSSSFSQSDLNRPYNDDNPIRIALLGGPKSGKTSIISKLSLNNFRDTYYPTHQIQPILFQFTPSTDLAKSILDENEAEYTLQEITTHRNNISIGPVIYDAYHKTIQNKHIKTVSTNPNRKPKDNLSSSSKVIINSKNPYYLSYNTNKSTTYIPPNITPILVELIDTPPFDPQLVVPFLEASLYIKLDKEILHNLANEPRKPVSTNPLLVASGASELNGNIDGYYFVYSAVPSHDPPSYEEITSTNSNSSGGSGNSIRSVPSHHDSEIPVLEELPGDKTFNLLSIMKGALDEAWREYYTFKRRWNQGKEQDIFSIKTALKNLWQDKNLTEMETMRKELRKDIKLIDNSKDPSDPECPPPIWIICTHINSPFASPKLIENGQKIAKFWKCGFVGIDNTNDNIDEALALIIREIMERKKLQKGKKR
ncbi:hypothetical protein DFJ63DRAFT_28418 [Scheffersomyces coipomensis]|uniref:uncharacterized protein n=1 Tax=Scheffersomyces coipomensis TaxID=1788519 RepID=UPI00315D299C